MRRLGEFLRGRLDLQREQKLNIARQIGAAQRRLEASAIIVDRSERFVEQQEATSAILRLFDRYMPPGMKSVAGRAYGEFVKPENMEKRRENRERLMARMIDSEEYNRLAYGPVDGIIESAGFDNNQRELVLMYINARYLKGDTLEGRED